ncbi:MAG TPA: hypothetical protein VJ798_03820 [Rhizomicrobium sp.]|nr:hypothetical protein [Rhizomicrobium sp.]
MLCCFLIALAAAPGGAWLIGPSQLACCNGRAWLLPGALAFGLSLSAALAAWVLLWLLLPGFALFHPLCLVVLGVAI